MDHKKCLLCESSAIRTLKGFEAKGLLKCTSCGFVFMASIPSKEELDKHYGTYSYGSREYISPVTIASYNKLLDEFEPYRRLNRMLDVGCGRGWFLMEARKRGWSVFGSEYSSTAVDICRANDINMKEGALTADCFDEGFDVITSFEVIEHINNPNVELDLITRFLRPGGLFYCTTPNFNSMQRYLTGARYNIIGYPEHLSYYTKRTLKYLARRHGLRVQRFLVTGLSINSLRKSIAKKGSSMNAAQAFGNDEAIRKKMEETFYLKWIKNAINFFLTLTGFGMTLKVYLRKEK